MLKKEDLLKRCVELKFKRWCIVDGMQHPEWKKRELYKILSTNTKKELAQQIKILESKMVGVI